MSGYDNPDGRYKYEFSLVACARWEADFILDWLTYHIHLGFDHIYLYCNDADPTELYSKVLPFTLGSNPSVTFRHFPFEGQQRHMYAHFLKTDRDKTKWITFLDIDEYINIQNSSSIGEFISNIPAGFDGVMFNWVFFGPNGYADTPASPIPTALTRRQADLHILTKYVLKSSFLDGMFLDNFQTITDFWHRVDIFSEKNPVVVNVLGERLDEYFSGWPNSALEWLQDQRRRDKIFQTGYINHYAFRSERAFAERTSRGTIGIFSGQERWKAIAESDGFGEFLSKINAVEDITLARRWNAMIQGAYSHNVVGNPTDRLISREGRASQSSRSSHSQGNTLREDATRAINGIYDGTGKFHTADEPRAWWKLELAGDAKISKIMIYNRIDAVEHARKFTRFTVELALSDLIWQEIFRKDDDKIIGGIDGFPLVIDLAPPHVARYVRIRILDRQFLHLDQVDIYGEYLEEPTQNPSENSSAVDRQEADKNLFSAFQSLGDNCEFGGIQRLVGLEPLALLKWCRTSPATIRNGIEARFVGLESVDNIQLTDHLGEYFVGDRLYGLSGHSFVKIGSVDEEKFRHEQAIRLRFLRDKFLEDLEDEPQNFIFNTYKLHDQDSEEEIVALARSISKFGQHVLVWVLDGSRYDKTPREFDWLDTNCLRIYKDEFTTFDSEPSDTLGGWRSICEVALNEISKAHERNFESQKKMDDNANINKTTSIMTQEFNGSEGVSAYYESSDNSIFDKFVSLGINCELGIVQKRVGITKLGLLDWFATHPGSLVEILKNRFEGIGNPEQTRLIEFKNEYIIEDTLYGFTGHTFISTSDVLSETFFRQTCARLQYLRRMMIEELEDGVNIFVYKMNYEPIHLPLMPEVARLISTYGPAILLCVSDANYTGEPDCSVKWGGPNLLLGHLASLAPYDQADSVDVAGWRKLCINALQMIELRRKSGTLNPLNLEFAEGGQSKPPFRSTNLMKNIAFGKPAKQSSLSEWSLHETIEEDAASAVDGNVTGGIKFHTEIEDSPWWQVDLQAEYGITEIRIFNRMEQPIVAGRASRLAILIGSDSEHLVELYRRETDEPFGGIDGNPLIFKPTIPIPGRLVRIRLLTRNYLHLDQVEVYGEPLPNFPKTVSTFATAHQP